MNLIDLMDYSGVAFFAATGSLVASRKQLDIIGFLFFGAITGLGCRRTALARGSG